MKVKRPSADRSALPGPLVALSPNRRGRLACARQRSLFPYAITQTPQLILVHSDTSNPRASVTYTHMNGVLHLEEDSIWLME